MKRIFRYLFPLLLFGLLGFYFWGSSGFLSEKELNEVITDPQVEVNWRDTLSVMTYNIGYLSGMTNNLAIKPDGNLHAVNLGKARKLVQSINPDFIGLQEIDYGSDRSFQVDQLDSLFKYGHFHSVHRSVNWDKRYVPFPYWPPKVHFGRILSGQAILSKYPIQKGERLVFEKPGSNPFYYQAFYTDRLIQIAHIDLDGVTLVILNVHLEAFDSEARQQQAKYLLEIYRSYARDYPVLLIGDFNARPPYASDIFKPENTIGLFLDEPDLVPAISPERYQQQESNFFTFNTAQPYEKLDYIFYNANWLQLVDSYVAFEAEEISDHFPVVMRFTLVSH